MNRHQRRALRSQGAWAPLEPAVPVAKTDAQMASLVAHCREIGLISGSDSEISAAIVDELECELWKNDRYQVAVRRFLGGPGGAMPIVHLNIKRLDRAPARDWRDLQRIKNQLVGTECEAIELYPAESRLVDTANSFHLWVVDDPQFRFPFGWHSGRLVDGRSGGGAVQRPIDAVDRIEEADTAIEVARA